MSTTNLVRDAFNFTVSRHQLLGPNGKPTSHYGLFRDDTGECIGDAVTDVYQPHQSDDVMAIIEAAEHVLGDLDINQMNFRFSHGHYVTFAPTQATRKSIYGTKDNIYPRFGIRAGYGGQSFKFWLGFYRDTCSNLARFVTVGSFSRSIRHNSKLREHMTELRSAFATLQENWDNLGDLASDMEAKQLCFDDFFRAIYGDKDRLESTQLNHWIRRYQTVLARIQHEREATERTPINMTTKLVTGWEAYNAVQGYVQHQTGRKGSPDAFDRILMSHEDSSVRKAETIVLAA